MTIDIIVAIDLNNGIGFKNELLYKTKADMQRFKSLTEGQFAIMGSKTWTSLPAPLKNRTNVIVSRDEKFYIDPHLKNKYDIILVNDLERVINHYQTGTQTKNLCVVGGSQIYKQSLPHVDKVYLTLFHDDTKESDSFFSLEYLDEHFKIIHKEKHFDEESGLHYSFIDYVRKIRKEV